MRRVNEGRLLRVYVQGAFYRCVKVNAKGASEGRAWRAHMSAMLRVSVKGEHEGGL